MSNFPQTVNFEPAAPGWRPVNVREMLDMYREMQAARRVDDYIVSKRSSLSDHELSVLVYMAHAEIAESSMETYLTQICLLLNYEQKPFNLINVYDIKAFLKGYGEDRQLKRSTLFVKKAAIKGYFDTLYSLGHISSSPAATLRVPKLAAEDPVTVIFRKALSLSQVQNIYEFFSGQEGAMRNRVLFGMLATMGMRVSEACGTRWGALEWHRGRAFIYILGKGGKYRLVMVPSQLLEDLQSHFLARFQVPLNAKVPESCKELPILNREKGDKTRPIGRKMAWRIIKSLQEIIDRALAPHWLRHTAFTLMAENGRSLRDIQDVAGHANIATSNLYVHAGQKMSSATQVFDNIGRWPKAAFSDDQKPPNA